MQNKEKGYQYETLAAIYLQRKNIQILERNFRCRWGEIDLIGIRDECLIFVEVKYRKNSKQGTPEEAVSEEKQKKICKVSDYYRLTHSDSYLKQVRYDVIAIQDDKIRWYPNAFPYRNGGNKWSY